MKRKLSSPGDALATNDAQRWAESLVAARANRSGVDPHANARTAGIEHGYEVQRLHIDELLRQFGGKVIGTKLAGGDPVAMAALGLSGPFRGPILSAFTHDSGACLRRGDFFICFVEAEIGLLIGNDIVATAIPPESEALVHSIEEIIPCIEIADSRHVDYLACPPAAVLADLAFAGAWIRGRSVKDWKQFDLSALEVRLLANGQEVRTGVGSRASGNPIDALRAMVADLGRSGQALRAGQIVSTGTYTLPYPVKAGESLLADFGPLGVVEVAFS